MSIKLKAIQASIASGAIIMPVMSYAQEVLPTVDVTTAVSTLTTDGGAAIAAIGGAMLTLAGIAIAFKWAKAAFFG